MLWAGLAGGAANQWQRVQVCPISIAPPTISARFLSEDERLQIADLNRLGHSRRAIAPKLGRHKRQPLAVASRR